MPPRKLAAYVQDVIDACEAINDFARGLTFETYQTSRMARSAIERQLMVAGEAVPHIRRLDAATAVRLGPVDDIIGFRNILVHGYYALRDEVLWNIINEHTPSLLKAAQALRDELPPPEESQGIEPRS